MTTSDAFASSSTAGVSVKSIATAVVPGMARPLRVTAVTSWPLAMASSTSLLPTMPVAPKIAIFMVPTCPPG